MDGCQPQFCNLLQVGLGAHEAQTGAPTGAVAEEKAALAKIGFFLSSIHSN